MYISPTSPSLTTYLLICNSVTVLVCIKGDKLHLPLVTGSLPNALRVRIVLDMSFPDMERAHSGGQRNRRMQVRCGWV